jgi:hypothetical protein
MLYMLTNLKPIKAHKAMCSNSAAWQLTGRLWYNIKSEIAS